MILFSKELVYIIADKKYHTALELVPIIIIGYTFVFLYNFFFHYAAYYKRTGLLSINTFIAGIANIVLNYIFIPKYGYVAAAYTTAVSYFLLFCLHYMNVKFVIKEKIFPLKFILLDLVIVIGITIFVFFIGDLIKSYILYLIIKIVIFMVMFYYFFLIGKKINLMSILKGITNKS